jgi:signal transduction histidine kinase
MTSEVRFGASIVDWLLNPSGLTPHGFCLSWAPGLVALHAGSDAAIGLAYLSIPGALIWFVRERRDLRQYAWMGLLFGAFILACGATHLFSIVTLWVPAYGIEGLVKLLTAFLSVVTAIALWPLVPRLLELPSPAQLTVLNDNLSARIAEQERTAVLLRESEARARAVNAELEQRVVERTAEILRANQELKALLAQREISDASLVESQERLRLAIGAYDLGIADADLTTGKLISEGGFERLLGLPEGGLDGDLDRLRAMVVSADPSRDDDIAAGRPQQTDRVRMRRADGELRDFHGVRRFFYSPDGAHVRTIGIYRDVTEERRAQAELANRGDRLTELRSELAHVSRLSAMGEMAAALAHELNQPLTAIGNSVGALKIMLGDGGKAMDDVMRARVVRAANQAEGQAVRAGEIVRRLRDFIARGEADARIEELDPLIEDAVALAAPNAKAEQIEVRLKLSPKAGRVLADRIQVQQILVNLIRNAAEAMRGAPGPHILTVSTATRRGMVEVSVRDTGPGMAPDFAAKLFSPFLSTKTTGMGVGLSICRRIVEAHGGRMWLEWSESGADFRFTIPSASKEHHHAE